MDGKTAEVLLWRWNMPKKNKSKYYTKKYDELYIATYYPSVRSWVAYSGIIKKAGTMKNKKDKRKQNKERKMLYGEEESHSSKD
jgi:hypothetical protein